MKPAVVILGAGKGTRMKSSTPKVLHKIANHSMLSLIIKEAQKISDDITVVVAHQADRVESEIGDEISNIKFLRQDDKNYPGTGGALRGFRCEKERVLILNGDMPLIESSELQKLLDVEADIVMTSINLDNPTGYGRVVEVNGEVQKIVEEKDASTDEKLINSVNAGVYLFRSSILNKHLLNIDNSNASGEYYLTDLIELTVNSGGSVKSAIVSKENFMGVNSKKQLSEAEEIFLDRVRDRAMISGVTMHLPKTIFIDPDVRFIGESDIEQNVTILGKTTIKESHIKAGTVIEDSYIDNSTIGVTAHIRPDSHIVDSKIGNFVEVKKSQLKGVKSGHLTYIGDSEIDEGTNIGAGVITCNYDGKAKHKTKIGKNVFVGSDSQLVAPVTISDDVMIGAGSTITADAPKGSLAISRIKMKIINGFFYKFFGK